MPVIVVFCARSLVFAGGMASVSTAQDCCRFLRLAQHATGQDVLHIL